MKMRIVFVGEYELTDNLKERRNAYGTADPIECAKIDMETGGIDPWLLLESIDSIQVAGIEPVNQ